MIFTNTRRLLTLWIGAFICAFSLHIVLGAQFYFQSTGVNKGTLSPIVMLTVVQEAAHPDVDVDFPDIDRDLSNMDTESEELQSDLSEQESENLDTMDEVQPEEPQHTEEKDDFAFLKSLEKPFPQEVERKVIDKKPIPIPKAMVKQSIAKRARSSITHQGGDAAAREDALLVEWLAKVQTQLEMQKKYVVGQRNSPAKGTVKLEFRVHEQGSIFSSRVVVSAGNPELDRLAMAALYRIGSFPPPPPSKVNKIIRVSLIFS
ncbi:TonB family domain-containing protein [Bartonella vinsonii subsp. arupensis OK-94-513]|uniref:TonB family domain-containing protein n=2 Tax=Bartonella vinsonii subsp. arupensis TaxID=110578 RepID=J0QMV7_BARVI|nr:TonB family protein [Bartonella vinsonii]EJF87011.1 TonB family domain-containing protein [Bartonella vinsonii subsp. arupensis OK-94-513]EJF98721.1 TonB family domain-containing protein [Bartonella vinsonii subsp. arupensis Pm136co]